MNTNKTKPYSLLVKPASADCNLRCEYCFYLDHCKLYPSRTVHKMSDDVLQHIIKTYLSTPQPQYVFSWQGGEPTLMGVDFYRRIIELQKKHGRAGTHVSNGLQTNATLIDNEFAKHLATYNFLIGVSLDGPPEIHNRYRRYKNGRGSHDNVMKGIRALERNKAEFNILVLVSKANVGHAREIYRYLCDNGFYYHQYIPCVEFDEKGGLLPFAIDGKEWGDFLCAIYDEWHAAETRKVSVRYFDSLLAYLVHGQRNICHMGKNCCQYFVVEYNGDVYPCDFFVERELWLGNVMDTEWDEFLNAPAYRAFGSQKADWSSTCARCPYLDLCAGDCLKFRLFGENPSPSALSRLCEGQMQFYRHALPGFRRLAEWVKKERSYQPRPAASQPVPGGIGRNQPCPCGSGKKYKRCCAKQ